MINMFLAFTISSLVGLTATTNNAYSPNYRKQYDFIDYEYTSYCLGDYDIKLEEFVTASGGQVKFFRIQTIIPFSVIEVLQESDNVYFTIPNYRYNSAVNLTMTMNYYINDEMYIPVNDEMSIIPLSMSMLTILPYTIVDLPYKYNPFDLDNWTGIYDYEIRLTFQIPYTRDSDPPGDWLNALRNLTIFTELNSGITSAYDYGYSVGYSNGNIDGYNLGFSEGFQSTEDGGVWNSLFTAVLAPFELLAIEIFPGVTIGMIALIPIVFGLIAFIFKLGGKGGG